MKKLLLLAGLALFAAPLLAQDEESLNNDDRAALKKIKDGEGVVLDSGKVWTKGGVFQLNFSQVQLVNWAAGGFSSVSGLAQLNAYANKRKGRWAWDNNVILAYGLLQEEGKNSRKTDDRLELNSRLGYELKGPWYGSALFQFRTQFAEGFDSDIDSLKISNFMAPAYLLFGLGVDYKPSDKLSAYFSPAMAKITFVQDQDLYYGNDELVLYGVEAGEETIFQFGAYANVFYTTPIAENITFLTRLELFSNYLDNPQNIDVNWETLWTFKVNEWFAATINTVLIYDDEIDIIRTEDGVPKAGPTTQFKQTLSLGLTAKF
ncbi:MAG TPA: DUF3078 domain-containing protein [Flavobacteriales bacterium]|nr:DUF3078 domain-containing protein [Flavobacteriales bacterium]HPQ58758.1 DUF3078 domain-containing protein [Flavobacteriales bacterium]